MLGIGRIDSKERKATPASMVERSAYRQSWSSDEPSSSSNSTKDSKSLWNKLRRRSSRVQVSQPTQPNRVSMNYHQGSYPYMDMKRTYSSPQTAKPVVSGTSVSVQSQRLTPQHSHQGGEGARNSMLWAAAANDSNAKQSDASARHQSLVPGLERLKTLSVLGSDTNVSMLRHEAETQGRREPAGTEPKALPANKPRSNSYLGAVDALKKAPAMARVSTDVYRSTGPTNSRRQAPAHSYSMDIPRASTPQQQQLQAKQPPPPVVDHKNADNISAESIQLMLGEYTGKSSDVKGKPRLRRLMMFPSNSKQQQQQQQQLRQQTGPQDRIVELSLGGSGLERIAEDEEQHAQKHTDNKAAFDEPESVFPPSDRDAGHARTQAESVHRRSQLVPAHDYRAEAKRFSENSGSTVSSGETLDTHGDHDGGAGGKHASSRTVHSTPPMRPASTQVVQAQPQKRPPRLSFSNGAQQRPKAIYNDGSRLVPSPTKEHPPKLVPIVHGQVAGEKEYVLDPTVYRNTFFNARPMDDQKQLETAVLNRPGRLSSGESTKFLVRSISDDTLNSTNGDTAVDSARVRFSGNHDYIPAYYLDLDNAQDSEASADGGSTAPSFSTSMPLMGSSSPVVAESSDLQRRPSEPMPSQKQPADHQRSSSSVANQEIEVLRRTIRILQSRNEMLSELVSLNPMNDVPDHVKTHIRTVELENLWLHRELARLRNNKA